MLNFYLIFRGTPTRPTKNRSRMPAPQLQPPFCEPYFWAASFPFCPLAICHSSSISHNFLISNLSWLLKGIQIVQHFKLSTGKKTRQNLMGSTNGGAPPASPTAPTTPSQENSPATTHTKNTAALCKHTTGQTPPPLVGSSLTRMSIFQKHLSHGYSCRRQSLLNWRQTLRYR